VQWQADHFEEIPVIVVACLNAWVPPWPAIASSSLYGSIYPSVQNLLLAARAAGLGAALITLPLWSKTLARWRSACRGTSRRSRWCRWMAGGRYGPTTRRRSRKWCRWIDTGIGRS